GVLRIGLDPLERRLGAHALDLELRREHRHFSRGALHDDNRTLRREKVEGGEVADVIRVEEDITGQSLTPHVLEQPLTPRLELGRGKARSRRVWRNGARCTGASSAVVRHSHYFAKPS